VPKSESDRRRTSEETILAALGRSDEIVTRKDDLSEFIVPNAVGLAKPQISWLWDGYVLAGKLTNIEAKGGGGKSRLLLGIAACLSNGCFPFGYEQEIIKVDRKRTLYFSTEDTAEEVAQTFEECGGDREYLHIFSPKNGGRMVLDSNGLTRLSKTITAVGASWVPFDPILEYAPPSLKSQNDNTEITKFMADLRGVAESTNSAIAPIRHFAKGLLGKGIEDFGAGGEAWRNGARGQFVLFPHPENKRFWSQFLVVPGRNSLRVQYGDPFAIEVRDGRQLFVSSIDVDWEKYCSAYAAIDARFGKPKADIERGARGPAPKEVLEAAQAIMDALVAAPGRKLYSKAVRSILKQDEPGGYTTSTITRARKELLKSNQIEDDNGFWTLLDDNYDPFADDPPNRASAPWAGLDD
jgi:hypothetical protein